MATMEEMPAATISMSSQGLKRRIRSSESAGPGPGQGLGDGQPQKFGKLAEGHSPRTLTSTRLALQRCITEVESTRMGASSQDLAALHIHAKRLVDVIDGAMLAACAREKEQAAAQAALFANREVEKLRRQRDASEKAAADEIRKMREERATVEALAAAERIKRVVGNEASNFAGYLQHNKVEDEISCFFRYLSS